MNLAEPLLWSPAPAPYSPAVDAGPEASTDPPAGAAPASGPPSGPSWEQYHALETRCRELLDRIAATERQAHEAGRKEGEEAAAEKWRAAMERMTQSVEQIASLRARLRREAEQDVVRLSLAIANRVVRRELSVDPEALLGLVRSALERVELRETHSVRVRDKDAAMVSEFLDKIGGPTRIQVIADRGLEMGSVLFETERGQLDASAGVQLEEIERGLADRLSRRTGRHG